MTESDKEASLALGLKILQLSEYIDWPEVMSRYRETYKGWTLTPSWLWVVLILGGIALITFAPEYWNLLGLLPVIISSVALGSRGSEAHERFQIGYEWGVLDGVCAAMDLAKDRRDAVLHEAREWRLDYRVNTGE